MRKQGSEAEKGNQRTGELRNRPLLGTKLIWLLRPVGSSLRRCFNSVSEGSLLGGKEGRRIHLLSFLPLGKSLPHGVLIHILSQVVSVWTL